MPTKLGIQLHDGNDLAQALEWLGRLKPIAVIGVTQPSLLDDAYSVLGAGPLYVFQRYDLPTVDTYLRNRTVEAAVDAFIIDIQADVAKLRWAIHVSAIVETLTPQVAAFEALAVQRLYDEYGVRLCIGNFATGNTPTDWSVYRPALEAAAKYHALIGLRERYPVFPYVGYGPNANIPDMQATNTSKLRNPIPYPRKVSQAGQLVGRYRTLRDYCQAQKIPLNILITEIGAGRVLPTWQDSLGTNLGDWRTLAVTWSRLGISDMTKQVIQDLVWLDQEVYGQDEEVTAACIAYMNNAQAPQAELLGADVLLQRMQIYLQTALQDQPLPYPVYALNRPESYRVEANRLRIRQVPSMNNKFIGNYDYGERFDVTHYTFNEGYVWVKHRLGWSAFAPMRGDRPDYTNNYLVGKALYPPQLEAGVNNFVGSIQEVRSFLQAHKDHIFYISIDPDQPPDGARQFRITTFPVKDGWRIIDELHPAEGDPLMTPLARAKLGRR